MDEHRHRRRYAAEPETMPTYQRLAARTGSAPPPPGRQRRRHWARVTRVLGLAVALVCVPVNDRSPVLSTAITPPRPIPVVASEAESHRRVSVAYAPRLEPLRLPEEDGHALVPDANPTGLFLAPPPIDLTVLPLGLKKIALDPGHGGKDLGATSPLGLMEKDVVLDIALRLRRLLQQEAFEVLMTRDKDDAIPLRQRTALANAQGADIFVSIHVNWVKRSQARGIETYYLGPTDDPALRQLVAYENRDSGYALADFRRLLDQIYLSVRRDASKRLAETVQQTLLTTLHTPKDILVNRGVKTAPFAVLVGTEMPAILTEVACLSNAADAQLLATPLYRQAIAQALMQGIRAYAQTLSRPPALSKQSD